MFVLANEERRQGCLCLVRSEVTETSIAEATIANVIVIAELFESQESGILFVAHPKG